VPLSAIYRSMD